MTPQSKQTKQHPSSTHDQRIVPINRLLLDTHNPRLLSDDGVAATQDNLVKTLWEEMSVDEITLSIAANGYFQEEPLFVIPSGDKFTVVEGNRRLAAVRLLTEPNLRKKINAEVPQISKEKSDALLLLPISIYKNRKELWEFIGFRHINGPKAWDAFSKAKYVAEVHEKYGIPLTTIANRIGDKHTTVIRLYRGYAILRQAEKQQLFNKQDIFRNKFHFSHLYTAADQPEFQKFLGITSNKLSASPIPKSKKSNLKELMAWLYGSREASLNPVVRTQNPDLKSLREILEKPVALRALRAGFDLDKAQQIAVSNIDRLNELLLRAKEDLIQASGIMATGKISNDESRTMLSEILNLVTKMQTSSVSATKK